MKETIRQIGYLAVIVLVMFGLFSAMLLWPLLILIPIFLLELAGEVVVVLADFLAVFFK